MSRHAERFPTLNAGGRTLPPFTRSVAGRYTDRGCQGMMALLQRIQDSKVELKGSLAFVNDWEYFTQGTPHGIK